MLFPWKVSVVTTPIEGLYVWEQRIRHLSNKNPKGGGLDPGQRRSWALTREQGTAF